VVEVERQELRSGAGCRGRFFQQRIPRLDAHGRKMLHIRRQDFQPLQFRHRRVQTVAALKSADQLR